MILHPQPTINYKIAPGGHSDRRDNRHCAFSPIYRRPSFYYHCSAPRLWSVPKCTRHAESHVVLPDQELWAQLLAQSTGRHQPL